jgi:hypothetical protein
VSGLDPVLSRSIARYEDALFRLHDLLVGLPEAGAHRSPGKGAWSVAQCLDHLVIVGTLTCARLDEAVHRARELTRTVKDGRSARFGWLDRLFIFAVSSGRAGGRPRVRFAHRPVFDPGPGRPLRILTPEFTALQDRLISSARSARGLDLVDIQVASVARPGFKASLGAWYLALAGHQERHLDQAVRTRALLEARGPGAS